MKRKLDAELVAVNAARSEAFGAELDAAALVDYGIHVVTNAGTLWRDAALDQKTALQAFMLPAGLRWGRNGLFEPPKPVCLSTG